MILSFLVLSFVQQFFLCQLGIACGKYSYSLVNGSGPLDDKQSTPEGFYGFCFLMKNLKTGYTNREFR